MLTPRKFMQRKKKTVVFKDAADEAEQKNWWRLMNLITETGSAVSVLSSEKKKNQTIPKDLLVGTLIRFKQLKKWNHVAEVYCNVAFFVFLEFDFKCLVCVIIWKIIIWFKLLAFLNVVCS
jgi:hypothetical protein